VDTHPLRRRLIAVGSVTLLALSLLGSLILMSASTQNSERFGTLYAILLASNCAGLLAFVIVIGINVRRLTMQLRSREAGAKLTLRMLLIFVTLAITPVVVLYSFSLDFLRRGIDSWFDVRVEHALDDALELGRESLDLRMRQLLSQTEMMADELAQGSPGRSALNLDALRTPDAFVVASRWEPGPARLDAMRVRSGAEELTLFNNGGDLLVSSSRITDIVPHLPPKPVLNQVRQGQSYIGLDPMQQGDLFVRVAVNVGDSSGSSTKRILHALYPVATRVNELAESIQYAYAKYDELSFLREKLKLSFAMTLTLVLLFSIVTAVWAAFHSARRLTAPIRDLAEGTAAVAAGDYEKNLPVESSDEIGFLVRSFNDMTRRIALAREEVETQHEYLNTVLRQLSSGVVTLDEHAGITTINSAALKMLEIDGPTSSGSSLFSVCTRHDHLLPVSDVLEPLIAEHRQHWQAQVTIFASDGRRVLMCRGTALSTGQETAVGYVIVFENITAIIQGQRDAAWSEVARRLAHEIKNPLTPIHLAAERMHQKYLGKLADGEQEPFKRLTGTIIQQVEAMKSMVDTFSDYAKTPVINETPVDVNSLLAGVVELFRGAHPAARLEVNFDAELPELSADATRLRQVFNNLVKNALEASPNATNAHIIVTTSKTRYASADHAEIRIRDHGEGIPIELLQNVFEPYVTNKTGGTGLGLAIVKKIVEEHNGVVTLRNRDDRGAVAIIRLPIDRETKFADGTLKRGAV